MDDKKQLDKLARSKWIDDLSDEEMRVLHRSHQLDMDIRMGKLDKPWKVGWIEDVKRKVNICAEKE